ncbi:uncharacterized protein TRUGW13939_08829 [Talaromyces rugulosus]|uniref:Methyltransferase domain-containing protein n=1 Tax=Talaromyces rugulosus TaxID=121627 RepID=A0A7H8R645_TALRU|nr:uncharacterized protein TRUGW13939_08829 [Talaromyces rugulosus]QKX61676.1 hypothetical protein TRUGW13939_08829 [Talaromyces rugulosus]
MGNLDYGISQLACPVDGELTWELQQRGSHTFWVSKDHGREYSTVMESSGTVPTALFPHDKQEEAQRSLHELWRLFSPLPPIPENKVRVLDIKCGTGDWANDIVTLSSNFIVEGFDVSDIVTEQEYCSFYIRDLSLPLCESEVDVYQLLHTRQAMQYIPDKPAFAANCFRALLPGGNLVIEEAHLVPEVVADLPLAAFNEWEAKLVKRYQASATESMKAALEDCGLRIIWETTSRLTLYGEKSEHFLAFKVFIQEYSLLLLRETKLPFAEAQVTIANMIKELQQENVRVYWKFCMPVDLLRKLNEAYGGISDLCTVSPSKILANRVVEISTAEEGQPRYLAAISMDSFGNASEPAGQTASRARRTRPTRRVRQTSEESLKVEAIGPVIDLISLQIGDTKKVTAYYESALERVSLPNLRILVEFIESIPTKRGGLEGTPPCDVIYGKTDYLTKEFLIDKFRQGLPIDITSDKLKEIIKPPSTVEILTELFHVQRSEERFGRDEIDATSIIGVVDHEQAKKNEPGSGCEDDEVEDSRTSPGTIHIQGSHESSLENF